MMEITRCNSDKIRNKLGTVTYTTKDGVTHYGKIYHDGEKIMTTDDSKLGTQVFTNTLQWVNALDTFLSVSLSTRQLYPRVNVNLTAYDIDNDIDNDIDLDDDNDIDLDIDNDMGTSFMENTDGRPDSPIFFCEIKCNTDLESPFDLHIPVNILSAPLFTEDVNQTDLAEDDFHGLPSNDYNNNRSVVHYQYNYDGYSVNYNADNGDFDY